MKKINLLQAIFFTLMTSTLFSQDGSLDPTFGTNGLVNAPFIGFITASAMQPDGKIVVAGWSDANDFALARFNSNGTLDDTFGSGGIVTTSIGSLETELWSIALQPDGKIVAAGWSTNPQTFFKDFTLARYDTIGSLDSSFGTDGLVITDMPFGLGDYVAWSVAIQSDDKIVAAGYVEYGGNTAQFVVARYNEAGALDDSFGTEGSLAINFSQGIDFVRSVILQPDGKIIVTGFSDFFYGGNDNFAMARLDTVGTLDSLFGIDGKMITDFNGSRDLAFSTVLQADGKILAAGYSRTGTDWDFALARFDSNGFPDSSFGTGGKVITSFGPENDYAYKVALQADEKIVAFGYLYNGLDLDFALARYHPDGTLDDSFGENGQLTTDFEQGNSFGTDVIIQPDGKIVGTGFSETTISMARYLTELNVGILDFSIMRNSIWVYPNPILENAMLEFTLKQKESISIQLVDLQGRTVKTFMENEILDAGEHDQAIVLPNGLPAGAYYIVMSTADGQVSIKIVR